MTSKERISNILNFKTPDHIGMYDSFLDSTVGEWRKDGMPADLSPQDYFSFDFEILGLDDAAGTGSFFREDSSQKMEPVPIRSDGKFVVVSFTEPFQRLCGISGREELLRRLARRPEEVRGDLADEAERITASFEKLISGGVSFDGTWAWGDLGYAGGLFFSPSCYRRIILPAHKKIFNFLRSRNIPILFHSDGMIYDIIPDLLDAGVRALHPLDELSGMDIGRLLKDYRDDMIFMGCVGIENFMADTDSLKKRIDFFKKNCFYIYHSGHPIMPGISFGDYSRALGVIKEAGAY